MRVAKRKLDKATDSSSLSSSPKTTTMITPPPQTTTTTTTMITTPQGQYISASAVGTSTLPVTIPEGGSLVHDNNEGLEEQHSMHKLNDIRIRALDNLNFIWDPGIAKNDEAFQAHVQDLKAFHGIHGHYHVTVEYDRKLSDFCAKMRIAKLKPPGTGLQLSKSRAKMLDEICFEWDSIHAMNGFFDACFVKLRRIHKLVYDKRDDNMMTTNSNHRCLQTANSRFLLKDAEKVDVDLRLLGRVMRQANRITTENKCLRQSCPKLINAKTSQDVDERVLTRKEELDRLGFDWSL
jgi:hypothetical protein